MFYIVKTEKERYFNADLVKHHFSVGDTGLLRKVFDGEIEYAQVIDERVYKADIPEDKLNEYIKHGAKVQDLSSALSQFEKADVDSQPVLGVNETKYAYGGFEFVRFSQIALMSKYYVQDKLPVMDVLGTRYIALDTCKKGFDMFITEK